MAKPATESNAEHGGFVRVVGAEGSAAVGGEPLNPRCFFCWSILAIVFVALANSASLLRAELPDKLEQLRLKAVDAESSARWLDACHLYDQILKADSTQSDIRERYQTCLRHVHQLRRHRDASFTKTVLRRDAGEALSIYEDLLKGVHDSYYDQDKTQYQRLYQQGLLELRFALEEEAFLQEHLRGVSPQKIRILVRQMESWMTQRVSSAIEARKAAQEVAARAAEMLDLNQTVTILELACGACNGLDEYTFYLTPSQLQYVQASLKGEHVGVGIKLMWMDGKLLISAVHANGPAYEKGLKLGDRIIKIDGQTIEQLGIEGMTSRLMGRQGSTVELEVQSGMSEETLTVKLTRQPVLVPSVEWEAEPREGIGFVRILSFQESTPQEVREAVLQLRMAGMKALIVDLRGNGGGHVRAAVQVTEMFLREGVIASTDSRIPRLKTEYKADNPHAWTMPLVVLIDGETASASELMVGALKEHNRATLVGMPTFGKGSIQCPLTLKQAPSGVWITVARFYSPTNQPYSGRGVTPHIPVGSEEPALQRSEAMRAAINLAMMAPR
jgi:carboxyl-terminal processing protease